MGNDFHENRQGGVLIAEENEVFRGEMARALMEAGFDVQEIGSADALYELVHGANLRADRTALPEVFVVNAALLAVSGPALLSMFKAIGCADCLLVVQVGPWAEPFVNFCRDLPCLRAPFSMTRFVDQVAALATAASQVSPPYSARL